MDIAESGSWWECRMEITAEWTFEGSPIPAREVGADGFRHRDPSGAHVSACRVGFMPR
jgi:hypothetical protein